MESFTLIGSFGHVVACLLFGMLALWAALQPAGGMRRRGLAGAALVTALWLGSVVINGDRSLPTSVMESVRNLAWLCFMLLLLRRGSRESWHPGIVSLYAVLGLVTLAEVALDLGTPSIATGTRAGEAFEFVAVVLRMMVAVGALVLVHNLYTAAAPEARWGIRLPMAALAAMWAYDLNLYTVAYLTDRPVDGLFALRGVLMVGSAALLALGSRRNALWKMRLSRAVTFQTLSLMAIGGYLVIMVLVVRGLDLAGIGNMQIVQMAAVTAMLLLGGTLLLSLKLRAWLRVKLVKHFFQHRYDYRAEWLRFTDTLGRPTADAAPLGQRIIKAIADITESPGGLLLTTSDLDGGLILSARLSSQAGDVPAQAGEAALVRYCEMHCRIIELDAVRRGQGSLPGEAELIPAWMIDAPQLWAVVPMIHFGRILGLVVLERPVMDRMLDWEDFDLLRVAGRQVASYLAEALGQEALSDARRFDEFNRRFAFIMHDIKNLVSQLDLLARNAERHADKVEFRTDMVVTLKNSVGKMNDLLARLSQHNHARADDVRSVAASDLIAAVIAGTPARSRIKVEGRTDVRPMVDPLRLQQALNHIVQNAVDASAPETPIVIRCEDHVHEVVFSVIDRGAGMSAEFIRTQLFRPFASTKAGGFGIGAYEARAIVLGMGGRLDVTSREGHGTRFDILVPAVSPSADTRLPQRKQQRLSS